VQGYFDKRDGRRYLYFRKPGHKQVRLPLPIGSEQFWAAYKEALAERDRRRSHRCRQHQCRTGRLLRVTGMER
jgi:hypothetical protein